MELTDIEERWLRGEAGKARQLAVRLLVAAATASRVTSFIEVEFAHINSCHWSGQLSLDFAEFLLGDDVTFAVPTHTNASLISCGSAGLRPAAEFPREVAGAQRLMEIYERLGCSAMWTCAPYLQPEGRPDFGQHVVGSESNAVSFFNSALGARTNKYGDLLDVAAAIVGRVPFAGLHTDDGRLATHEFRLEAPDAVLGDPAFAHVLGVIVGQRAGNAVPVIVGAPGFGEDDLKAIAAAAATAGAVELFHVVGVTPEANTLADATGDRLPDVTTIVTAADVERARSGLSSRSSGPLSSVCLGTPHFSLSEFEMVLAALDGRRTHPEVAVMITTSRAVAANLQSDGLDLKLAAAGIDLVTDTCTYYPPRPSAMGETVMTNSAKWAYYAPGMLGIDVAFADLASCVESAVAGEIVWPGSE